MSHDHGGATNAHPASQSRTSRSKTHKIVKGCEVVSEIVVDLAGYEAFEAAQDVLLRQAFGESAGGVVTSSLVVAQTTDSDQVQGAVGLAIPAAVQAHPVGLA